MASESAQPANGSDVRVGVQLHPQHCSVEQLRDAWQAADGMEADSIWTWDHFFPLYGPADGEHFEGWSLLAAMACDTTSAKLGLMVGCNSYRNPELVADMARTVDHLSGGRLYLGLGAGWFERDYDEYGFEFGTAGDRLADLAQALPRIKARLAKLNPRPVGDMPILIGGSGEKKTLRYTAQYADAWNTFGPPDHFAHKNRVLNEWCEKEGRNPDDIERTVCIAADEIDQYDGLVEAGATHVIVGIGAPFDLDPLQRLMGKART